MQKISMAKTIKHPREDRIIKIINEFGDEFEAKGTVSTV